MGHVPGVAKLTWTERDRWRRLPVPAKARVRMSVELFDGEVKRIAPARPQRVTPPPPFLTLRVRASA